MVLLQRHVLVRGVSHLCWKNMEQWTQALLDPLGLELMSLGLLTVILLSHSCGPHTTC